MPLLEFIKQNLIACGAVFVAFAVLILIIVMLIIGRAKKSGRDEIAKLIADIPIEEDEVAVCDANENQTRTGDADLKWLRDQSFACEEIAVTETDENTTKEENKMAKTTTKATEKAVTKKKTVETKTKAPVKVTSATEKIKAAASKSAKPAKKAIGKWVVREKGDGEFVSYLHANNGEIILTSEIYASADSAKKGIATIKKSIDADGFQLYCDKNRNYYYKLKNASNRFLCAGETYPTKASCLSAVESVKRFADSPILDEIEKDLTIIKYVVPKAKAVEKKSGYSGKWVITDVEDMYIAQLFASNGELLLSSEAYTTANSAKSAIETITTNGIAGNFIIDVDKKGRYFFKLRNAQKSTLCVGETYAQQAKCESAIESVRRFLATAKLVEED
ncbi:MAG: DUF1508 domain-containing protein [Clostridiales bacterium]|nr:DUF1508 domain-containing protein [Clostridiales bacterium]